MARKGARAKAPAATPEERAACETESQIRLFKKKIRRLPQWPEVDMQKCKALWRADHGVELATGDMAYKKIFNALKNDRNRLKGPTDPRMQEKRAAMQAAAEQPGAELE